MHYLSKRIKELSEEDRMKVIAEVLDSETSIPKTRSDKYALTLMADHTSEAKKRLQMWGQVQGLSSGYHSLDAMTKGLVGGELVVVAGKTSNGKTTLAMNISNRVALRGKTVLFVTLEMTHVELTSRYMYINGGDTEDYHTVASNTVFQRHDELDWQDIDGLMAKARADMNVDLVVIDHLHYFTRELEQVSEDLGRITKEIKKNAIRYDIPVMLISHVRKVQDGKKATIDDLRSSSYIAQDADIVLMVGQTEEQPDKVYVEIQKNRNRGYDRSNTLAWLKFEETKLTEREDTYGHVF